MPEAPRNDQGLPNQTPGRRTVSGRKFHVIVAGTTNGAHRPIVEEFKGEGWTEVMSAGECDYLLVFCPVASRVGTDISEALDRIPAGKKAILVVMHYTFDRHHVIAPSSRLVQNPDVLFTLDCLFHENRLLNCELTKNMWHEVYRFLGVPQPFWCRPFIRCMMHTPVPIFLGILMASSGAAFIVLFCFAVLHILDL